MSQIFPGLNFWLRSWICCLQYGFHSAIAFPASLQSWLARIPFHLFLFSFYLSLYFLLLFLRGYTFLHPIKSPKWYLKTFLWFPEPDWVFTSRSCIWSPLGPAFCLLIVQFLQAGHVPFLHQQQKRVGAPSCCPLTHYSKTFTLYGFYWTKMRPLMWWEGLISCFYWLGVEKQSENIYNLQCAAAIPGPSFSLLCLWGRCLPNAFAQPFSHRLFSALCTTHEDSNSGGLGSQM